jgi:hypothetical protein
MLPGNEARGIGVAPALLRIGAPELPPRPSPLLPWAGAERHGED